MLNRIWTLSTVLSLSRIVLLAPFAYCILVDVPGHRTWAAVIVLMAVATDFLDGYVARAWHQVTDFGKVIDPLADKIVIGIGAILVAWAGDLEWWVVGIVLVRDLLILAGGILIRRKKRIIVQSNWPGKVAVTAFAVLILLAVLRPDGWEWFRTATLWFSLFMAALSLGIYAQRLFIGRSTPIQREA